MRAFPMLKSLAVNSEVGVGDVEKGKRRRVESGKRRTMWTLVPLSNHYYIIMTTVNQSHNVIHISTTASEIEIIWGP